MDRKRHLDAGRKKLEEFRARRKASKDGQGKQRTAPNAAQHTEAAEPRITLSTAELNTVAGQRDAPQQPAAVWHPQTVSSPRQPQSPVASHPEPAPAAARVFFAAHAADQSHEQRGNAAHEPARGSPTMWAERPSGSEMHAPQSLDLSTTAPDGDVHTWLDAVDEQPSAASHRFDQGHTASPRIWSPLDTNTASTALAGRGARWSSDDPWAPRTPDSAVAAPHTYTQSPANAQRGSAIDTAAHAPRTNPDPFDPWSARPSEPVPAQAANAAHTTSPRASAALPYDWRGPQTADASGLHPPPAATNDAPPFAPQSADTDARHDDFWAAPQPASPQPEAPWQSSVEGPGGRQHAASSPRMNALTAAPHSSAAPPTSLALPPRVKEDLAQEALHSLPLPGAVSTSNAPGRQADYFAAHSAIPLPPQSAQSDPFRPNLDSVPSPPSAPQPTDSLASAQDGPHDPEISPASATLASPGAGDPERKGKGVGARLNALVQNDRTQQQIKRFAPAARWFMSGASAAVTFVAGRDTSGDADLRPAAQLGAGGEPPHGSGELPTGPAQGAVVSAQGWLDDGTAAVQQTPTSSAATAAVAPVSEPPATDRFAWLEPQQAAPPAIADVSGLYDHDPSEAWSTRRPDPAQNARHEHATLEERSRIGGGAERPVDEGVGKSAVPQPEPVAPVAQSSSPRDGSAHDRGYGEYAQERIVTTSNDIPPATTTMSYDAIDSAHHPDAARTQDSFSVLIGTPPRVEPERFDAPQPSGSREAPNSRQTPVPDDGDLFAGAAERTGADKEGAVSFAERPVEPSTTHEHAAEYPRSPSPTSPPMQPFTSTAEATRNPLDVGYVLDAQATDVAAAAPSAYGNTAHESAAQDSTLLEQTADPLVAQTRDDQLWQSALQSRAREQFVLPGMEGLQSFAAPQEFLDVDVRPSGPAAGPAATTAPPSSGRPPESARSNRFLQDYISDLETQKFELERGLKAQAELAERLSAEQQEAVDRCATLQRDKKGLAKALREVEAALAEQVNEASAARAAADAAQRHAHDMQEGRQALAAEVVELEEQVQSLRSAQAHATQGASEADSRLARAREAVQRAEARAAAAVAKKERQIEALREQIEDLTRDQRALRLRVRDLALRKGRLSSSEMHELGLGAEAASPAASPLASATTATSAPPVPVSDGCTQTDPAELELGSAAERAAEADPAAAAAPAVSGAGDPSRTASGEDTVAQEEVSDRLRAAVSPAIASAATARLAGAVAADNGAASASSEGENEGLKRLSPPMRALLPQLHLATGPLGAVAETQVYLLDSIHSLISSLEANQTLLKSQLADRDAQILQMQAQLPSVAAAAASPCRPAEPAARDVISANHLVQPAGQASAAAEARDNGHAETRAVQEPSIRAPAAGAAGALHGKVMNDGAAGRLQEDAEARHADAVSAANAVARGSMSATASPVAAQRQSNGRQVSRTVPSTPVPQRNVGWLRALFGQRPTAQPVSRQLLTAV